MTPRLATHMVIGALIRRVNQAGGTAMVLNKGDEQAGAILLVCAEKGRVTAILERIMTLEGGYQWVPMGTQNTDNTAEISEYLERRKARDSDLWVVELDIADAERFAAETNS